MAFTSLYGNYYQAVYAFAYRYLHSSQAAQDVVQHTFVKIWETRAFIDPNRNFKNLLLTIAKNHMLNHIRDKQFEYHGDTQFYKSILDRELSEEVILENKELSELIAKAIEGLSPKKREICRLKVYKGLSNSEISEQLGISVNTVKVEYNQSVKQLRVVLKHIITIVVIVLSVY